MACVNIVLLIACATMTPLTAKGKGILYSSTYADTYIERAFVPGKQQKWAIPFDDYQPPVYNACPSIVKCDGNVPENISFNEMDGAIDRHSLLGKYKVDSNGYPLNPKGRTGVKGRGLLRRWGPNYHIATVITRGNDPAEVLISDLMDEDIFDFLSIAVESVDDPNGIKIPPSIARQLEYNLLFQNFSAINVEEIMEVAVKSSRRLYAGFTVDERNTDNAWVETIIYQIDDGSSSALGLVEPKLLNSTKHLNWVELNTHTLWARLEKISKRAKLNYKQKVIYEVQRYIEAFRKRTGKKNVQLSAKILGVLILFINIGVTVASFG